MGVDCGLLDLWVFFLEPSEDLFSGKIPTIGKRFAFNKAEAIRGRRGESLNEYYEKFPCRLGIYTGHCFSHPLAIGHPQRRAAPRVRWRMMLGAGYFRTVGFG